jgi:predicted phosphoribosyltransferase
LDIERVTRAEKQELERREQSYRGGRPPQDVSGLIVILVDDGIATGSSMRAAIRALRQMNPARIVLAVPVAPPSTCSQLQFEVDELVCLEMPKPFYGVGRFYDDFTQVSDEEVIELLDRCAPQEIRQRRRVGSFSQFTVEMGVWMSPNFNRAAASYSSGPRCEVASSSIQSSSV